VAAGISETVTFDTNQAPYLAGTLNYPPAIEKEGSGWLFNLPSFEDPEGSDVEVSVDLKSAGLFLTYDSEA
jgi:hypothetical protein